MTPIPTSKYVALKINSVVRLSSALMAMALIPTAVVAVPAWPDHVLAVQSALVVNQSDPVVRVHAVSGAYDSYPKCEVWLMKCDYNTVLWRKTKQWSQPGDEEVEMFETDESTFREACTAVMFGNGCSKVVVGEGGCTGNFAMIESHKAVDLPSNMKGNVCGVWIKVKTPDEALPQDDLRAKTKLRNVAMLMTHDAATGLVPLTDVRNVGGFFRTQNIDLLAQVQCGARALDLRLIWTVKVSAGMSATRNAGLYFHHGGKGGLIDYSSFAEQLHILKSWGQSNPNELLILTVTNCHMGGIIRCDGSASDPPTEAVKKAGVAYVGRAEKEIVKGMTYADALTYAHAATKSGPMTHMGVSALPSGLLVIFDQGKDLVEQNYDPKVTAAHPKGTYSQRIELQKQAFERFNNYAKKSFDHRWPSKPMWMFQAFWQWRAADQVDDLYNVAVFPSLLDGSYDLANLFEVNWICNRGTELASWMHYLNKGITTIPSNEDIKQCKRACSFF